MRLERAFLLEALNKHMEYNVDDSDRSSSPPPTPTDKPLRSKRSHPGRKGTPPQGEGDGGMGMGMGGRMGMGVMNPMSSAQSTPDPGSRQQNSYFGTINAAPSATSPHTGVNGAPPPPQGQTVLPPLHMLQQQQQQAGQRQYYDPTYDEQRPEEDAGRRRAYSGAQQPPPPPPPTHESSAAPQNGDTEMADASTGFTATNH
jgi:hypothetical protein